MNERFFIDAQTLKDLEILPTAHDRKSVLSLLNNTQTKGGAVQLRDMLEHPLNESTQLTERRDAIKYFQENQLSLKLNAEELDFAEYYLRMGQRLAPSAVSAVIRKIKNDFRPNNDYYLVSKGVAILLELTNKCYHFSVELAKHYPPALIWGYCNQVFSLFSESEYKTIFDAVKRKKLTVVELDRFDYLFRQKASNQAWFVLNLMYEYDAFQSVANAAVKYNFSYPAILSGESRLSIAGLFHPFVANPVANDVEFVGSSNLCFVTGANMAGKSTFLKSLGVAVYLAHVGFPVPASSMSFTVLDGLMTTINLSDNVSRGYSHFYSEVVRIKEVTAAIEKQGQMLIIFDELFRGTNVKDAYDGSLAIISAFSNVTSCFFAVSTHITEVAEGLKQNSTIQFKFFETMSTDSLPTYTYKLKDGISSERLGMYIIRKEGIIEHIEQLSR